MEKSFPLLNRENLSTVELFGNVVPRFEEEGKKTTVKHGRGSIIIGSNKKCWNKQIKVILEKNLLSIKV